MSDFVIDLIRALVAWPTAFMVACICLTLIILIQKGERR